MELNRNSAETLQECVQSRFQSAKVLRIKEYVRRKQAQPVQFGAAELRALCENDSSVYDTSRRHVVEAYFETQRQVYKLLK